jgi:hypothetical protein
LRGGGAKGVGRLQGMASLHPTAAPAALTDVDVELAVSGLPRDLDRVLLSDVVSSRGPPQSGQTPGKGASWVSSIWSGGGGQRRALVP